MGGKTSFTGLGAVYIVPACSQVVKVSKSHREAKVPKGTVETCSTFGQKAVLQAKSLCSGAPAQVIQLQLRKRSRNISFIFGG